MELENRYGGERRQNFWRELWHAIKLIWSSKTRYKTSYELDLESRLRQLQNEANGLREENKNLQAEVGTNNIQIEGLLLVISRHEQHWKTEAEIDVMRSEYSKRGLQNGPS